MTLTLPDFLWNSIDSASGVNELVFIENLHDHPLTQLNQKPFRGNSILDIVITSVPNRVNVTDILSLKDTGFFTDHSVIIFQFNAFIKGPPKTRPEICVRLCKRDFEGLRTALSAINLSSIIANDDINTDWHQWKDTFLAAVSDYIQTKRLKGRNHIPWMSGAILNLIGKKKEYIRQKLKLSPSSHLREKLKNLRKRVKRMLRNSRDEFLGSVESDLNTNPKRFWSILKLNFKSHTIRDRVRLDANISQFIC